MKATQTPQIWSEPLLELTRSVMNLCRPQIFIYLKNINGEFGAIKVADWLASKLCAQNRETFAESKCFGRRFDRRRLSGGLSAWQC